ncbi:MAG: hypothetical protein QM778_06510 [Myxococcales bacterium]
MTTLRPELQDVVARLIASAERAELSVDEVGEALGTLSVSTLEIEAVFAALEAAGGSVRAPGGGGTELHLKRVVEAARAIRAERELRPTLKEIAARAELTREQVLNALFLLRIMQR